MLEVEAVVDVLAGEDAGLHVGVDHARDVALDLVGFEAFGEDEPEGVLGGVGAGGGEGELPGGSLFDVGVGLVGGGSSGGDGGGFGEGDSSVLAVLGDDDILEEGFYDEL